MRDLMRKPIAVHCRNAESSTSLDAGPYVQKKSCARYLAAVYLLNAVVLIGSSWPSGSCPQASLVPALVGARALHNRILHSHAQCSPLLRL